MARLIDPAATDAAVNALYDSISRLVSLSPGMYERKGDGTSLVHTGLPVPTLNVVRVSPQADPDQVEAFAAELSAKGVPWSIELRTDPGPADLALAARHGRTTSHPLPLRVWDTAHLSALPPADVAGTTVREIGGSETEVFATALANGFGMPRHIADIFASPALLDAPDMTAFVLERDGEAVATGFNIVVGDRVGLYNGAVPPQHRGNGYYRALVLARLAHAVGHGARHAFTQNSAMSGPLYEALGFRVAETWTYLTG